MPGVRMAVGPPVRRAARDDRVQLVRCDLCSDAPVACEALLGGHENRRVLLCLGCHHRFAQHDLDPAELQTLARTAQAFEDRCRCCGEAVSELVAAQIASPTGPPLDIWACEPCAGALSARNQPGPAADPLLANDSDEPADPRYVHALDVQARRRDLRLLR